MSPRPTVIMFSVVQMIATVVCSMGMLQLLLSCWCGVGPGGIGARRSLLLLSGMMFSFSAVLQGVALSLAATMISGERCLKNTPTWSRPEALAGAALWVLCFCIDALDAVGFLQHNCVKLYVPYCNICCRGLQLYFFFECNTIITYCLFST